MNLSEFNRVKDLPYHQYLGVEDLRAEEGQAALSILVKEHILNPAGSFHGGVLYTVCEVAAYSALMSVLEEEQFGVTNHISVQVIRAAQLGDRVDLQAYILKKGRKITFLECEAKVGRKLVAKASISKTMIY